uniref:Uncharacterized protein n=1 Tax=Meloidogyne javanica TaxID=6303 RepID=A0A915MJ54_MELJA
MTTTKRITTKKAPIDGNLYSQFTAQVKVYPTIATVKSTKTQQRKPGPEIYLRTSKQDPNVLQFLANVYELGCLPVNYEKVHRNKLDKKCKLINKSYNKECEEGMWKAFQICYKSKLDPFNLGEETDNSIKVKEDKQENK